jgi:predicted neuraminidase
LIAVASGVILKGMKLFSACWALAISGLVTGGAWAQTATSSPSTRPGVVASEFIYDEAPFPSCHASTIVESSGEMLAAWFGGTDERNPDVGIWLSRRDGEKWLPPVEVANGVVGVDERYPTWNPVLFQPKTGPLLLFYKVGPTPKEWWGMRMTSDDGGRTWSKPERLPDGIVGPVKHKPVTRASGDLLAGSSTEADGWRVHFERSSDNGCNWQATPPVNDAAVIQAIQPSILIHRDGRLQAVGRTQRSGVFQIWSDDQGRTWGKMASLGLPNPSSGTDAVTLADGRHLLVYNHNVGPRDRSPLNVAVSDDGLTWQAALVLEDEPGGEFSYPAVIQTSDGLVHVTYTWHRKRIKHAVIDPVKLVLALIVDGQWPAMAP